jgi:coiled-coil and C2 domain-containing protein 2A
MGQMPDLWCTSQEFLDLGAGDVEEHGVLLCNYFNFIDQHQGRDHIESYLMLGLGYPEGRTAYVMRRDKLTNHVELWNPMRGEAYFFGRDDNTERVLGCIAISSGFKMNKRMNDAICQLKAVGCVIGRDNIWANVQEFDDPGLMTFDLEDGKAWKSFFTKSNRGKYFPSGAPI